MENLDAVTECLQSMTLQKLSIILPMDKPIKDSKLKELLNKLFGVPNLTHITFDVTYGCKIEEGLEEFCESISNFKGISMAVMLGKEKTTPEAVAKICESMKSLEQLQELKMITCDNSLEPGLNVLALAKALPNLQSLIFCDNSYFDEFDKEEMKKVLMQFTELLKLQKVYYQSWRYLSNELYQMVYRNISKIPVLKKVKLIVGLKEDDQNEFESTSELVMSHPELESLYVISAGKTKTEAFLKFLENVKNLGNLKKFGLLIQTLTENKDEVTKAMGETLSALPLTKFHLSGFENLFTNENSQALAKAYSTMQSMVSFKIKYWHCSLTKEGVKEVIGSIAGLEKIEKVKLCFTGDNFKVTPEEETELTDFFETSVFALPAKRVLYFGETSGMK